MELKFTEKEKELGAPWLNLMEMDGDETPAKLKYMVLDIMWELAQQPMLHDLLTRHAVYLRGMYEAFDEADKMMKDN